MKVPKIFNTEPCEEAVEWLKSQRNLKTAWNKCTRGDWMWWALMHGGIELSQSTCIEFANDCAARAKNYTNAAAFAAYAATYADYAANAAANADYAAAFAAADAADAAYAAANAAANADYAAAFAAYAAEKELQANWIREHIPYPF
jgi:hypothetical protein